MAERSVTHGTFTLERTYPVSPARVFAAWKDADAKAQWFVGPPDSWTEIERSVDFRVGGRERLRGRSAACTPAGAPAGHAPAATFDAQYLDIVPNQRIVYLYEMYADDVRTSVSLATVELEAVDGGTRLTLTEQGAYLDGLNSHKDREHGTVPHLERLGEFLESQVAAAV